MSKVTRSILIDTPGIYTSYWAHGIIALFKHTDYPKHNDWFLHFSWEDPCILIGNNSNNCQKINKYSDFNIVKTLFNLSQSEIDDIINELKQAGSTTNNTTITIPKDTQLDFDLSQPSETIFSINPEEYNNWKKNKEECKHKFKFYQGLNESFEYCEFCDEKRK